MSGYDAVDLRPYDELTKALDAAVPWNTSQEGGSYQLQKERQAYIKAAASPCVRRVCEIGFNRGHSAALWLRANPEVEVLAFDLWQYEGAELAEKWFRSPAAAVHVKTRHTDCASSRATRARRYRVSLGRTRRSSAKS